MNKIVRRIGATVIGLLSIAVPVLTAVATLNKWNGLAKMCLVVGDLCEFFIITAIVYERSEE